MNSYVEVFSCEYTRKQINSIYGKLDGFSIPKNGEKVFLNIPYTPGDIHGITSIVKSPNKSTYGEVLYKLSIEVPNK